MVPVRFQLTYYKSVTHRVRNGTDYRRSEKEHSRREFVSISGQLLFTFAEANRNALAVVEMTIEKHH